MVGRKGTGRVLFPHRSQALSEKGVGGVSGAWQSPSGLSPWLLYWHRCPGTYRAVAKEAQAGICDSDSLTRGCQLLEEL